MNIWKIINNIDLLNKKNNQSKPDTEIICLMHRATKIKIIILLNIYFTKTNK